MNEVIIESFDELKIGDNVIGPVTDHNREKHENVGFKVIREVTRSDYINFVARYGYSENDLTFTKGNRFYAVLMD